MAYDAARTLDAAVSALVARAGTSLKTYTNWSLVDLLVADRHDTADAVRTLTEFAMAFGVPTADLRAKVRAAQGAFREPAEDVVTNAFWSHGIRGWPPPRWVRAWRYGGLPASGQSFNFRDRTTEPGISAAFVEGMDEGVNPGAGKAYGVFFGDRPVVWMEGFLREDVRGGDGEPLLVGARPTAAPRRTANKQPRASRTGGRRTRANPPAVRVWFEDVSKNDARSLAKWWNAHHVDRFSVRAHPVRRGRFQVTREPRIDSHGV